MIPLAHSLKQTPTQDSHPTHPHRPLCASFTRPLHSPLCVMLDQPTFHHLHCHHFKQHNTASCFVIGPHDAGRSLSSLLHLSLLSIATHFFLEFLLPLSLCLSLHILRVCECAFVPLFSLQSHFPFLIFLSFATLNYPLPPSDSLYTQNTFP